MNNNIRTITILWHGLEIAVPVTSFKNGHAMPIASTPDCPGYDDSGEPAEVEFNDPVLVRVDCPETFIEFLNLQDNDDFREVVLGELSE